MPNTNHRFLWRFLFLLTHCFSAYFYPLVVPNPNGGLIVLGMIIISASANAAPVNQGLCDMITKFQEVFKLLRTLAFVGAGFILAKYGWDAISSGKLAGSENVVDGLKKIGLPMIIGFALLFSIGILLNFLSNGENFGCMNLTQGW